MQNLPSVKAFVLAAGKGTRLNPIADNLPKHLLEIGGKPILKRIVDDLLEIPEIEDIVIIIHYYKDLIEKAVDEWYQGKDQEKIQIIYQNEPYGTGHAVQSAIQQGITVDCSFMIVYGDLILANGIKFMMDAFRENKLKNYGAILGAKVDDPTKYGVLKVEQGKFTHILEKPKTADTDALINAGVFILPQKASELIAKIKVNEERQEIELTEIIELLANDDYTLEIVPLNDGWFDIGRPWSILNANEYLLEKESATFKILGEVEDGVTIKGSIHIANGARIRSGAYIEGNVFIDEGADIGPNCFVRGNTYLGKNVRIGNACEVKNSVIYHGTHVAHLSYIGDSVIGRNSNLGAGTITANLRHDNKSVKMAVKNIREDSGRRKFGAVIGDNVKIGIGVNILPGVKISSNTWINSGKTVDRDC